MNSFARNLRYFGIAMIAAVFGIAAVSALGQAPDKEKHKAEKTEYKDKSRSFCENNNWSNGDKVSVSDLREMTVASTGSIRVDAGKNGGVTVKGEDRSDVLVRACVQAWGATEEAARAAASAVKIGTGSEIKADGPSSGSDQQWSVSYQILVPRATNTNLKAHNGGISLSNVEGNAEFETLNGGINVSALAGNVKGRTVNGGVNVSLAGNSWQGSGLDLQTTNGGVKISMPATYAATVETGTVNGGYRSDIPALNVTTENLKGDEHYRSRAKRVQTALNGGGAPIKVMTTNGGVMISTTNQ
jgi:hypothetical protein